MSESLFADGWPVAPQLHRPRLILGGRLPEQLPVVEAHHAQPAPLLAMAHFQVQGLGLSQLRWKEDLGFLSRFGFRVLGHIYLYVHIQRKPFHMPLHIHIQNTYTYAYIHIYIYIHIYVYPYICICVDIWGYIYMLAFHAPTFTSRFDSFTSEWTW